MGNTTYGKSTLTQTIHYHNFTLLPTSANLGRIYTIVILNIWQISFEVESNMNWIYSLRGAKRGVDYSVHIR